MRAIGDSSARGVVAPASEFAIFLGLTPIRTSTFWWVSQLGMIPGTIVYIYAGSTVPDLQTLADRGVGGILTPQLFAAFAALGLFPIVVRRLMNGRELPTTHDKDPA